MLRNRGPRSKLPYWTKIIIHTSQSRARIRKLPVQYQLKHVIKIDILSGHEEKGNLRFILKIIFYCIFIEKPCIFTKFVQLIMKVWHIVQRNFVEIFISETMK